MSVEENKAADPQARIAELEKENKAADLQARIAELEKENKALKGSLDKSLEAVEEISAKLDLHESSADSARLVKIGKKTYRVIGKRFVTPKGELTVDELLKDKAYLQKMVDKKSGVLVEVIVEKGEQQS